MTTLEDSLVSSASRKLPLRMRADLAVHQHRYEEKSYWVIKEPFALRYFRFQEDEFAILRMLDGNTSLEEIKEQFEDQFRTRRITLAELHHFLGRLHQAGLVLAQVPDQGAQLYHRRQEQARRRLLGALTSVLALRFRGIDPERLLTWMHPRFKWVYSPWCVALCLALATAATLLVTVQFETFRGKLPGFHAFFTVENAIWLSVAIGVTKIIHEFGHGLTCKHFGGECHEMGFMMLVLTPCLYCNVSDSWTLPNKWQRAAIGAAGMYIEVVMASIATFLWWFSEPGLLNYLCLSTMFVCSVSTVVFNGNPLMRYDGYYILSDLMEIPNLRQKASQILARKLGGMCLGIKYPPDPFLPKQRQALFAAYTVAAAVYRWVVTLSILWFLNKLFEPYGLKVIGQLIALASVVGLVFVPLWQLYRFFSIPGRVEKVSRKRMAATTCVVAALVAGFVWIPFPHYVHTSVVIEPRDAQSVYVQVSGTLEEVLVRPGEVVEAGQVLARLTNLDLKRELVELGTRRDEQQSQVDTFQIQRFREPAIAARIPAAIESLADLESSYRSRQADLSRLSLTAPTSGSILPPPETPDRRPPVGMLHSWSRTPLEPKNLGGYLDEGTLFCQVGDPQRLEAVLVIDQTDIEFVRVDQNVEVLLDQLPGTPYAGRIAELAAVDLKVAPRHLSATGGGQIATERDATGIERPLTVSYQARFPLDTSAPRLRPGLSGRAKIRVGSQTWGQFVLRYLAKSFQFEW